MRSAGAGRLPAENGAGRPGISGIRSFFGRDRRPPERTSQISGGCSSAYRGEKILTKETDGNPVFCGVECADHKKIVADDCIVCTGGCSYASTGSTGDGYRFAEETGHKVTERKPALVPLEIRENWCRELMGLSLKMWRSGCSVGKDLV